MTGNSAAISLLSDSSSSQHDEPKGPFALWFSGTKARFKPVTRKLPEGWRFGVTLGAILSSVTLIINATVVGVAYSWMKRNDYTEGKIPPVFTGHCDKANKYSTGVHLAINVLSSMLLGASNYCMQCLSAPTRKNIDKAHRTGKWLDIGVQSMKNLRFIGPKKLFFWICLAVSSIPLHLVYAPPTNSPSPLPPSTSTDAAPATTRPSSSPPPATTTTSTSPPQPSPPARPTSPPSTTPAPSPSNARATPCKPSPLPSAAASTRPPSSSAPPPSSASPRPPASPPTPSRSSRSAAPSSSSPRTLRPRAPTPPPALSTTRPPRPTACASAPASRPCIAPSP